MDIFFYLFSPPNEILLKNYINVTVSSVIVMLLQTHPEITKRLSSKFRAWLKKWASANVSDVQHKQCTDWLMGRGEGVVPNRTRVLTDNDLSRTPYVSYNRYRVERLNEDAT
jgi:paired amphipathic helix protein Sin3a